MVKVDYDLDDESEGEGFIHSRSQRSGMEGQVAAGGVFIWTRQS